MIYSFSSTHCMYCQEPIELNPKWIYCPNHKESVGLYYDSYTNKFMILIADHLDFKKRNFHFLIATPYENTRLYFYEKTEKFLERKLNHSMDLPPDIMFNNSPEQLMLLAKRYQDLIIFS